jgi:hypothetical protein
VATHTSPPEQPVVDVAPTHKHASADVDPVGGIVVDGVPSHVPPVAGGTPVTCSFGTDIVLVLVHAPSLASQVDMEDLHDVFPNDRSMLPTRQDGEVPGAQAHAHTAGPPVGGVTTELLFV